MIFTQEECKTKPELAPSEIHIYILTNPRISECAAALGDRDFKDDTNPHTWYPYKKTRDHTNTEGRPQEDTRQDSRTWQRACSEKLTLWNQDSQHVALSQLRPFRLPQDSVKSWRALSQECILVPDFKTQHWRAHRKQHGALVFLASCADTSFNIR